MRRVVSAFVVVMFVACGGSAVGPIDDAGAGDAAASDGAADGSSSDGSSSDGPSGDGSDYACSGIVSSVDPSFAACNDPSDCSFVLGGCYCGDRPALGVSAAYESAAEACETRRSNNCGLGCLSGLDIVAQDGKTVGDASAIALRCEAPPDGGAKQCLTYVP